MNIAWSIENMSFYNLNKTQSLMICMIIACVMRQPLAMAIINDYRFVWQLPTQG